MSSPTSKSLSKVSVEAILPHNLDAERSVLGAIMLDEKAMIDVQSELVPSDFFSSEHRTVYEAMVTLREANQPIDISMLMEGLQRSQKMTLAGGVAYLTTIPDGLPRVTNVPHYVKIVKNLAALRQMIHTAEAIQARAFDGGDAATVAENAIQQFTQIGVSAGSSLCMTRREASESLLVRLENAEDSKIVSGVGALDEVVGGFYPGELIVYVAKPGVGKSFLALQTATQCCRGSQHGLYCSGEMPAEQLMARELASATGVSSHKLRRPSQLTTDDFARLMHAAAAECKECEILPGNLTIPNIRKVGRQMKDRGKLKFMAVDYDELVEVRGTRDEWEAQAMVTAAMKSMAMEWGIPVVMISQLRKSLNNEDFPTLDDLYGSGRKAKDASIVIYISRPFVKNLEGDETEASLYVLKSRDGRMGKVDCMFDTSTFRFRDRPAETDGQKQIFPDTKARRRGKRGEDEDS